MSPHNPLAGVAVPTTAPVRATPERTLTGAYTYRLRNAQGEVIYIGTTNSPDARMRAHELYSAFWAEVETVEYGPYIEGHRAPLIDERRAIATERPRHNIQFNPDRDRRPWVRRYLEQLLGTT